MRAIALRFGLTMLQPQAVHAADFAVFAAEWARLMTASGPLGWGDARGIELVLMTPRQAEQAFMDRFARLRDAAAGPACRPGPILSQVAAEESDVKAQIRAATARKAG